MSPGEKALVSLLGGASEALTTAVIALVRDALAGEPANVIQARAERVATLQGHHALIDARAEARKAELAVQGQGKLPAPEVVTALAFDGDAPGEPRPRGPRFGGGQGRRNG